jgi:uncharacterized protein YbaR (Trm112 family)
MAAIAQDLLALLACPETHEPLALASDADLAQLKSAIEQGKARRRDGRDVPSFDGALLAQERRVAYLISAGIPNLLVDERLELSSAL